MVPPKKRVFCFVDGFNLYHSIVNINQPHLKWLNLRALASVFVPPQTHELVEVYYFSAYANWLPDSRKRHKIYVKALIASDVKTVMGNFKNKDRKCAKCHSKYSSFEEKETDVNIALAMLHFAYQDLYDEAFLISNDSDQAPAIRMVRNIFPAKKVKTIVPPHYSHSNELIQASSDKAKITIDHLNRCLLKPTIYDAGGNIVVTRPPEYAPPA